MTLLQNRSRSTQGHDLYKLWWASPRCYTPSFVEIGPLVPEKKIFYCFYHIWAWRPSWSCDLDHLYKLSFPLPMDAPHEVWLKLAKQFQRRRSLKLWTTEGRRTDAGPWPSYKLTLLAFGSGELKIFSRNALMFFLFLHQYIDCGYSLKTPLSSTHNLC